MPIKWRRIGKRPIPDAWKEIQQRTSIFHLRVFGPRARQRLADGVIQWIDIQLGK
jgi:hypothetical protein